MINMARNALAIKNSVQLAKANVWYARADEYPLYSAAFSRILSRFACNGVIDIVEVKVC